MEEEYHRKLIKQNHETIRALSKSLKIDVVRRKQREHVLNAHKLPVYHYIWNKEEISKVECNFSSGTSFAIVQDSSTTILMKKHIAKFGFSKTVRNGENCVNNWTYKFTRDSQVKITDMPLEVFEHLVWYLDGNSFYSLCYANRYLFNQINEAISYSKDDLFWNTRDLNMKCECLANIAFSFCNTLEVEARKLNEETQVNWAEVYKTYLNLDNTIEDSVLCISSMDRLKMAIHAELKLGYEYTYPQRITIAIGSLLCNIYNKSCNTQNQENIFVMEDMNPKKCYRTGIVCQNATIENVHSMKILKDNSLTHLVITVCPMCIWVYPLMEGNGCMITIDHDDDDDYKGPLWTHSNILRDVLGVAINGTRVELYRIQYSHLQVTTERLHRITLTGFSSMWNNVRLYPLSYLITVKEVIIKVALTEDEKIYYETQQVDPPVTSGFGLSVNSYHYGHILFRPKDTLEEQHISSEDLKTCYMNPIYYYGNYELLQLMKFPVGGCSGCGMEIFWSDEAIAVSFDSVTWHLKDFYDGVRLTPRIPNFFRDDKSIHNTLFVTSVKICDPGLILAALDNELVFIRLKLDNFEKGKKLSSPRINWEILRRIEFGILPLNLSLTSIYFDFNQGQPYLFLELHDYLRLANPLRFCLKKVDFTKLGHDDSGFVTDLDISCDTIETSFEDLTV